MRCYQVCKLGLKEPPPLPRHNKDNICSRCKQQHAGAVHASNDFKWARETLNAIHDGFVQSGRAKPSFEPSLWDLFEDPREFGPSGPEELQAAVCKMSAPSLPRLREWIGRNREEIVAAYGERAFGEAAAFIGTVASLRSLPPDMLFLDLKAAKSPIKGAAMRADSTKWDLMLPFKISSLIRHPRFYSERDVAKLLGISRSNLNRIVDRAIDVGFPLDKPLKKVPHDTLEFILWGERPRKPHS